MLNKNERKVVSMVSSTEEFEFWRNFEWGPYQVNVEDQRDDLIPRRSTS